MTTDLHADRIRTEDSPFEFRWEVTPGYAVKAGMLEFPEVLRDRERPHGWETREWLVHPSPVGVEYQTERFSPLHHANLHRRIANRLDPARRELTAGRILRVASEFGMLTQGTQIIDGNMKRQVVGLGEPVDLWINAANELNHLISIWDLVRGREAGPLGQIVRWRSPLVLDIGGRAFLNGHALKKERNLIERWKYGDPIEPARFYVHHRINEKLRGAVSPAVLPFMDGQVQFFPKDLLSAVYTLFMMEVSGRVRPAIICEGCGLYFIPEHGRQKHHNQACRQEAYRRRKSA